MEDWVQRVAGILGFARGAVLVLVDHARIDHLRALLVGLEPIAGEVPVVLEPWELEELPHGATVVYEPLPEHARELNAARPLFADRGLRVILWCSAETSAALATGAPDFFDWVSHRVECPGGAATFFLEGLEIAKKVGVGGVIAVFPSGEVQAELVKVNDALGSIFEADLYQTIVDIRLARAFDLIDSFPIVVETHPVQESGWWALVAEPAKVLQDGREASRGMLTARQVAMLRGELEAIRLASNLLEGGMSPKQVPLGDRGLLRASRSAGLVREADLYFGAAPAPLLRAAYGTRTNRRAMASRSPVFAAAAPAGWRAVFAPSTLFDADALGNTNDGLYRLEVLLRCEDADVELSDWRTARAAARIPDPRLRAAVLDELGADEGSATGTAILAHHVRRSVVRDDYERGESLLNLIDPLDAERDLSTYLDLTATRIEVLSARGRYARAALAAREPLPLIEDHIRTAPLPYLRIQVQLGLNAARWHRPSELAAARAEIERATRRHLLLVPAELPEVITLDVAESWMSGRLDKVEHHLGRPEARGLDLNPGVLRANARWLQGRPREGLELLEALGDPTRFTLPTRAQIAIARGRCAIDAGDPSRARLNVSELLAPVERGLGPSCHVAAQLHLTLGEAHLALGSYAQARDAYVRALAILRDTPDYTDLPDRWIAELARALLPSETDLPAATSAFTSLSSRLGAEHPLTRRWQLARRRGRARAARS